MAERKNIFAIIGSASENSSNFKLVELLASLTMSEFAVTIFDNLRQLPHFSPELSIENTPSIVTSFRQSVEKAHGILICTPEYIFSIPSGLKNAIEWCVATTVFSNKPTGIITASANGQKAHEELQLIMKTVEAKFTEGTSLLIPGIKGKIDRNGNFFDNNTVTDLMNFIEAYKALVANNN